MTIICITEVLHHNLNLADGLKKILNVNLLTKFLFSKKQYCDIVIYVKNLHY